VSLNFTDKNSVDRTLPTPNSPDVHENPLAHGATSIAPRATGTQPGAKITNKNDTIIVYDASNERIVIGRLPDGTYGMAISKAGFNVSDAIT